MLNWKKWENKLYKGTVQAIRQFAKAHPKEAICFLAFDSEPRYGYVILAFDTLKNNLRTAQEAERYAIDSRRKNIKGALTWQWAQYQLTKPVLSVFNTNSGDFAYSQYAEIGFPEWQQLAESGDYPKGAENEDDYLDSNARILFWKVSERLIKNKDYEMLTLASPFMIGYGIHDEEAAILRVLNWPRPA